MAAPVNHRSDLVSRYLAVLTDSDNAQKLALSEHLLPGSKAEIKEAIKLTLLTGAVRADPRLRQVLETAYVDLAWFVRADDADAVCQLMHTDTVCHDPKRIDRVADVWAFITEDADRLAKEIEPFCALHPEDAPRPPTLRGTLRPSARLDRLAG